MTTSDAPFLFSQLEGASSAAVASLARHKILSPTPIQRAVFHDLYSGSSVMGFSKTGTGKTLAYLLPLLSRKGWIEQGPQGIGGLILVPTRELATQVADNCGLLSASIGVTVVVGGESEDAQIQSVKRSALIAATPGRLLDLVKRRLVELNRIEFVVFDEADRLLDMGFKDEIRALLRFFPKSLQYCFFSATMNLEVEEMAYEFGVDFVRHGEPSREQTVEGLDHRVCFVGEFEKFHALAHFIQREDTHRGIVFSNYKDKAHDIDERLRRLGLPCRSLSSQLSQGARTQIMDAFRTGKIQVLIASDVASRGLDVDDVDWVVNYDLPEDPAVYVHRVGRTARAGRQGRALSFVGFEDAFRLDALEKFLSTKIPRFEFEPLELSGTLPRWKVAARQNPAPTAPTDSLSRQPKPLQRSAPATSQARPLTQQPAPASAPNSQPVRVSPSESFLQRVWKKLLAIFVRKKPVAASVSTRRRSPVSARGRGDRRSGSRGATTRRPGRHSRPRFK